LLAVSLRDASAVKDWKNESEHPSDSFFQSFAADDGPAAGRAAEQSQNL